MKRNLMHCRQVLAALLVVVGLLMLMPTTASAQADRGPRPKPQVLPLDSSPYGNTYGEWSARWWQWLLAIPEATNPNLDTTGAHCAEGQVGPVWFLAGTFGGAVTRSCAVPAGKALLLTPLTQIQGSGVFDCEPTAPGLCNLNVLRALAAASQDNPTTLKVTVDGVQLPNLSGQRVQSPVFSLTFPDGAVFGLPSGTFTPQVADGYWVLLAPLSAGAHTLHIHAVNNSGFEVDVTYNLTVGDDGGP